MKRTWERVLGIIGVCLDGLAVIGGLLLWVLAYVIRFSTESYSIPTLDFFAELIFLLSFIVLFFVVISLICFILGLIGVIKLKNNPRLSGYLFLIAAGISGFINIYLIISSSLFFPIQTVVYLIAGILCLRDKPQLESGIKEEEI